MKNLIGGILSVIIGSTLLTTLLGSTNPGYLPPYDAIWFLLLGGHLLGNSAINLISLRTLPVYAIVWIVIGGVASLFSQKGWNVIRTAVWIGIIQGLLSLGHILLTDSSDQEITGISTGYLLCITTRD